MSSLPILSSQTPNNGKIASSLSGNGAPNAEGISNGAAPFGELLAKQLAPQGRDSKADLLKKIALEDSDKLAADLSALTSQAAVEVRTDGVAIPTDFLASLLPQGKRAAMPGSQDTAGDAATSIADLSGKADARDPSAPRIPASAGGEAKPDARLASGVSSESANGREDRASSGIAPGAAFAAALQAETKTGIRSTTGKIDTAILSSVQSAPSANVIGMPNTLAAPAVQTTQATIATPVNQPQWADDFSQKVTWLATQRTQSAELHLNPAQLGPLEVSLKLNGDHATVQFTSAHAAVRDAIEQSIPRLRDMLADSGISLGNTTVSDQAPREQQKQGQASGVNGNRNTDDSLESDTTVIQATTRLSRHDGVVDTFA